MNPCVWVIHTLSVVLADVGYLVLGLELALQSGATRLQLDTKLFNSGRQQLHVAPRGFVFWGQPPAAISVSTE
jgi:hypothetical protein